MIRADFITTIHFLPNWWTSDSKGLPWPEKETAELHMFSKFCGTLMDFHGALGGFLMESYQAPHSTNQ